MTREEKIKGLYILKEYLVENPIKLEGHKSLPITLIDYAIEALEQEPKTGHWIGCQCDKCGYIVQPWNTTSFCPNCGTKMADSEDKE